jgi:hypothetical protein
MKTASIEHNISHEQQLTFLLANPFTLEIKTKNRERYSKTWFTIYRLLFDTCSLKTGVHTLKLLLSFESFRQDSVVHFSETWHL